MRRKCCIYDTVPGSKCEHRALSSKLTTYIVDLMGKLPRTIDEDGCTAYGYYAWLSEETDS